MRANEIIYESQKVLVDHPGKHPNIQEYMHENAKLFAPKIREICSPWLEAINNNPNNVVYRGITSNHEYELLFLLEIRKDRKPLDSSQKYTKMYNAIIKAGGGIANRNNSMFVSGNPEVAEAYGTRYIVMPVGDFHYTWSDSYQDWHHDIEAVQGLDWYHYFLKSDNIFYKHFLANPANPRVYDPAKIREEFKFDTDLAYGIETGNEILIAASHGLYIDPQFYKVLKQYLFN